MESQTMFSIFFLIATVHLIWAAPVQDSTVYVFRDPSVSSSAARLLGDEVVQDKLSFTSAIDSTNPLTTLLSSLNLNNLFPTLSFGTDSLLGSSLFSIFSNPFGISNKLNYILSGTTADSTTSSSTNLLSYLFPNYAGSTSQTQLLVIQYPDIGAFLTNGVNVLTNGFTGLGSLFSGINIPALPSVTFNGFGGFGKR